MALLGPGFSQSDLVGIALFALNYALVAPISAVCVLLGVALRKRRSPSWLGPVGWINVLVALPQLALFGSDLEWWLTALLVAQVLSALAVIGWTTRARRVRAR